MFNNVGTLFEAHDPAGAVTIAPTDHNAFQRV